MTPQRISTAIKLIGEDSLTDTCSDSQLHCFAINVEEETLGNLIFHLVRKQTGGLYNLICL